MNYIYIISAYLLTVGVALSAYVCTSIVGIA